MWTTGYIGGVKVSFTFPIRNEMEAYGQAKAITDKLIADGFTTTEPGLEAGEQKEPIGWIARRAKADGTPILDLYLDNEKWVNRLVMCYLDDDESIKAFESATGLRIDDIPLYNGDRLERGTEKAKPFIVRVAKPTQAVIKDNPHYNPTETDIKKKKPARLFIRWVSEAETTPVPPPAAAAQAGEPTKATPEATPEPPRNARLQNEELVITRVTKIGKITGNPDPNKNGDKYEGWGKIWDGGTFDVRVVIFPEDVIRIKEQGYEFPTDGGAYQIPIIMDTTDRAMTRIGQVVPKNAGESDLGAPDTENGHSDETVNSFVTNQLQSGKPVLIFKHGDNYAYSYTREPFRKAGYNVDGWDVVGNHMMPTPAKLTCVWDKQHKQLIVKSANMLDVFAEAS